MLDWMTRYPRDWLRPDIIAGLVSRWSVGLAGGARDDLARPR